LSTPIKRKLATILSADVAGYSRLMEADEEGTLRLLSAHRAIIDSVIDLHDGRVVNTAGDSVLAEFTSPVEAVRAAIEIQDALRTRNETLPESRRMLFRIGVNIGDVMLKGDDLLGDGVNIAARLQTLAEPGGLCISGSVFDQIEGKLSLRFQDIGEQALKNIARPVRALRLHGPVASAPGAPSPRPAPSRRRGRRHAVMVVGAIAVVALAAGAWVAGLVPTADRKEAAAWETVRSSSDPAALEGYLAKHPAGAHADEARGRLAALLASARQAAEAERARAEADLARAKAEAEAARARAEAEAIKARADIDRKRAEDARLVGATPATSAAITSPAARESRFDGSWVGEVSCPEWRGGSGFQRPQRAVVRNGEMTLDLPAPGGRPRPIHTVGRVRDDDSIDLRGPGFRPGGKILERVIHGRFGDNRFTGQADFPARACSIQLSREPASARSGS
jgi:class 3 adenylate cyclase